MSARDVVKGFLDQLAGGNAAAIVPMFTEDGVIDMPGGDDLPWAGTLAGPGGAGGLFPGHASGARHARACHQDLGGRRRCRVPERRRSRLIEAQRQTLSCEMVLGLHRARRTNRALGRLRGHPGALCLRPLALSVKPELVVRAGAASRVLHARETRVARPCAAAAAALDSCTRSPYTEWSRARPACSVRNAATARIDRVISLPIPGCFRTPPRRGRGDDRDNERPAYPGVR